MCMTLEVNNEQSVAVDLVQGSAPLSFLKATPMTHMKRTYVLTGLNLWVRKGNANDLSDRSTDGSSEVSKDFGLICRM